MTYETVGRRKGGRESRRGKEGKGGERESERERERRGGGGKLIVSTDFCILCSSPQWW
jgi:hypothetical protein